MNGWLDGCWSQIRMFRRADRFLYKQRVITPQPSQAVLIIVVAILLVIIVVTVLLMIIVVIIQADDYFGGNPTSEENDLCLTP